MNHLLCPRHGVAMASNSNYTIPLVFRGLVYDKVGTGNVLDVLDVLAAVPDQAAHGICRNGEFLHRHAGTFDPSLRKLMLDHRPRSLLPWSGRHSRQAEALILGGLIDDDAAPSLLLDKPNCLAALADQPAYKALLDADLDGAERRRRRRHCTCRCQGQSAPALFLSSFGDFGLQHLYGDSLLRVFAHDSDGAVALLFGALVDGNGSAAPIFDGFQRFSALA
mmetsp:Transcript_68295/g.142756  ORF Transcript_68295/g.142756 Transcript_68295/m.142756 type:complete len:222 (+) Transcript_68295:443-1108(+)